MSGTLSNPFAFLRTSREFPEESRQFSLQVSKTYIEIAGAVNGRTIGLFPTNKPAITGEAWFLTNNQLQRTLREVYTFGAIPAGTSIDIAHGISTIIGFTRIYGTVITVADYRPLPYTDPDTPSTGMALLVNATTIHIRLGTTAVPVKSGQVVLEWLTSA